MLFGQWEDNDDRERKQIKTKMYREMLDNQILINERYRREKKNSKEEYSESQFSEKRPSHKKQHIKTQNYHYQPQLNLSKIRTKSNHINLPSIKDKNTYYPGSSKFIRVEQQKAKPASQSPLHADTIQQDEQDLDEYNNTCEKIIRELKSINKETPKMKYRRKLYEYSDLAPNRKRYEKNEKTKIEEMKNSEVQLYNNYDCVKTKTKEDYMNTQNSPFDSLSIKNRIGSDDRIPSFSVVNPSKQRQTKQKVEKPIYNQSKFKPKQEYPANQFEQVSAPNLNTSSIVKPKTVTEPSESSTMHMSTNLPAKNNNLERSRMRSNIEVSKSPPSQITAQNDRDKNQLQKGDLKMHKQNFINLLRKVKNRGESLFIKLNAFPTKSQTPPQKK